VTRARGFVVCIDNRGYPASLEKGKIYRVCRDFKADLQGWLRVIDESGEDYLYPQKRFSPVKLSRQAARALSTTA
jgi:hypothetical protein